MRRPTHRTGAKVRAKSKSPRSPRAIVAFLVAAAGAVGCAPGITDGPPVERIRVPGGTFLMGSTSTCSLPGEIDCFADRAPHPVLVAPFELNRTEVSLVHYTVCVGKVSQGEPGCTESTLSWDYGKRDRPVPVSIEQARHYCQLKGGRLPTEAEWELAARYASDGVSRVYPWGDTPRSCLDVPSLECAQSEPRDVGASPVDVSPLGVHDLAGNLPEWVEDDYVPAPACDSETAFDIACGANAACVALLCDAAGTACHRGCARGLVANGSAPFCAVSSRPVANPLHRTATPTALIKGGGYQLPGCFQEPGIRSPIDFLPKLDAPRQVGFRCAYDVEGSKREPRLTQRVPLPAGLDCATFSAKFVEGSEAARAAFANLDVALFESGVRYPAMRNGDQLGFACTGNTQRAVLVLSGATLEKWSFSLQAGSSGDCRSATVAVEAIGEIPLSGLRPEPRFEACR